MSYEAIRNDKRAIVLRRASDNSVIPCDGSGRYVPGESILVQLSPFDVADSVAYAEHLLEIRGATEARFLPESAGCDGRRFAGQFQISSAGVVDQSTATLVTRPDDRGTIGIVGGWQRTLGPVQITPTCLIAPEGATSVDSIDAPVPSPAPVSRTPSSAPSAAHGGEL